VLFYPALERLSGMAQTVKMVFNPGLMVAVARVGALTLPLRQVKAAMVGAMALAGAAVALLPTATTVGPAEHRGKALSS
jgi:hypothetical protein